MNALINKLLEEVPSLHMRNCRDCGHIGWCADYIEPHSWCTKCRSKRTFYRKDLTEVSLTALRRLK